jgi:serine/threonine-protein kinase HipA
MADTLIVLHRGRLVGTIERNEGGLLSFEYAGTWLKDSARFAISMSLPLGAARATGPAAHAFFANLLPEGPVREAVARRLGLSAENDFALLEAIGGECAGALAIVPDAAMAGTREPAYEPLPEDAIARMARESSVLAEVVAGKGTRLSLAGAQDKLPVFRDDSGRLHLPLHGAPTTHILKVPSKRFRHLPANEVLVARVARAVSLPSVDAELLDLGGTTCALVRRFDRAVVGGALVRLHQEDLCQAIGRLPTTKYQEEGGPGIADAMRVIRESSADPLADSLQLLRWVAFGVLAGNSDGHGKNIAFLYGDRGPRLAPFYDLVCTRVYRGIDPRIAMSIGGQRDPGAIGRRHWQGLAAELRIGPGFVVDEVEAIARALPDAVDEAIEAHRSAFGDSPILQRIRDLIVRQCRRSLRLLGARE